MALERLGASLQPDRFVKREVNRFVSTPEQLLALRLAKELDDEAHKQVYLHWSKHLQPALLEETLRFVIDANADNKGALFSWKLKQVRATWLAEGKNPHREVEPSVRKKKKRHTGTQVALFGA